MFSLLCSEGFATFLAAKVYCFTPPLKLDGLAAGNEFFANWILFQGVTQWEVGGLGRLTFPRSRRGFSAAKNQPEGNIEEDAQDDDPQRTQGVLPVSTFFCQTLEILVRGPEG